MAENEMLIIAREPEVRSIIGSVLVEERLYHIYDLEYALSVCEQLNRDKYRADMYLGLKHIPYNVYKITILFGDRVDNVKEDI